MTAEPNSDFLLVVDGDEARRQLLDAREALRAGRLAPYLGPGLLGLSAEPPSVPATPEAVAEALHKRSPAPSKIRTNMWSVAQHIEQRRHRRTLQAWMSEIFAAEPRPTALHHFLAGLRLPMIVDSWYDGAMRAALIEAGRTDVSHIQGITRAGEFRDVWTRLYDLQGHELAAVGAEDTLLYEPHGGARPSGNFLVADSDYVEVLTEIDIQTPIPEEVRARRQALGFLFLGCRFDDQMLRTYARQIIKRSKGPHFAVIPAAALTKNERRFLATQGIVALDLPLAEAQALLVS